MDALDIEKWEFASDSPGKSICISSILLGLVLVGRAAFVFLLSFLSNLTKKTPLEKKITWRQQIIIWWAGLMRGAVSISLAYNKFTRSGHTQLHSNAIMIISTIIVVLFSTMVFGVMTKPLIQFLLPASSNTVPSEPSSPKSEHSPLLTSMQGSDLENATASIIRPSAFGCSSASRPIPSPKSLHSPLLTSMQGSDLENATASIIRPSAFGCSSASRPIPSTMF